MPGIIDVLKKRAETPIEERSYGGIYLLLSGFLFIGTMWSVIDEVSTRRPWKEYQSQYLDRSAEGWKQKLGDDRAALDSAALADLRAQKDSLDAALASTDVVEAQEAIDKLDHRCSTRYAVTLPRAKGTRPIISGRNRSTTERKSGRCENRRSGSARSCGWPISRWTASPSSGSPWHQASTGSGPARRRLRERYRRFWHRSPKPSDGSISRQTRRSSSDR